MFWPSARFHLDEDAEADAEALELSACGGEGSGVPGPCPSGVEEEKGKEEKGKEELKEHTRPNKSLPEESRPPLEKAEAKAVRDYTSPETKVYHEINKSLREGKEPEGKHAETNKELQSAMAKVKEFKEPVTAYRGLHFISQERQDQFAAKVEAAKKDGSALEFAGYSSTSTSRKEVEAVFSKDKRSALIEIEAKKGLDVKSFSKTPDERELLLDRSSKFEVVSSEKVGGQLKIKLRQIVTPAVAPKSLTWLQARSQAVGKGEPADQGESRFVDNGDDHVAIVPLPAKAQFLPMKEKIHA